MAEFVTVFEPLQEYDQTPKDQCDVNNDTFHKSSKQLAIDCFLDQSSSNNQWKVYHSNKVTNKHKGVIFYSLLNT